MTFLTSVKDYIKRHRTGLLVTATIAGGGYLAGKYATTKIMEIQERTTAERMAKENLKRRFQQNQNDCVFTVLSLLPSLGDQILHEMNIEAEWAKLQESRKLEKIEDKLRKERELAASLREESVALKDSIEIIPSPNDQQEPTIEANKQDKGILDTSMSSLSTSISLDENHPLPPGILSKKEKHVIWEDIKVMSFVRTLTSIYSITLLTLLTHIQLNLLGRFTYMWSISILNKSEPTIRLQHEVEEVDRRFLDPQVERMFLSASWWLLHRGWRRCAAKITEAVEEVISGMPLKTSLNYHDTEIMIQKMRRKIEYEDGKPTDYHTWLLPDTQEEEAEFLKGAGFDSIPDDSTSTLSLRRLLDETKDFIDSPDFHIVLSACLNEVFSTFDHHAFVKPLLPDVDPNAPRIREISADEALKLEEGKRATLANLLPNISRQAHLVIAGNEYLNAFAYIKELQAFSAIIYTQYNDESIQS
ncbi:Peroxin-3 [Pilobolus umbonatus]|nr:Peroxin-3 [Pilobolus umbonatus]